jgi:uncharacterized protein
MEVTEFTPLTSALGGALIGLASVALMASNGRIAGISGIAVRLFPPYLEKGTEGRILFILGLVAAPWLTSMLTGAVLPVAVSGSLGLLIAAGLLVGFGSVWGSGCTSGHGVCGLSRLSQRSFVAVGTFMATAFITVFISRHLI